MKGTKAPDGSTVRLEALRLGGRWVTNREALQRFAEASTPQMSDRPTSPTRTTKQRTKAAEKAERELEKLGI